FSSFTFNHTPPPYVYTLSLHDALPIFRSFDILAKSVSYGVVILSSLDPRASATLKTDLDMVHVYRNVPKLGHVAVSRHAQKRMEIGRHTSELQSPCNLVCRLLLEKKNE